MWDCFIREIWDTGPTMVVVMSSAVAVIEDFSQDTLGRYEKRIRVRAIMLISFSTITGSVINRVIYDVKLAHAMCLSCKIIARYCGITSH